MNLKDAELRGFVAKYLTSFVMWDLFDMYAGNPGTEGKVADIAYLAGREPDQILPSLSKMVEWGFLERSGPEDDPVYRYEPPAELRKLVKKFSEATAEREFRLTALVDVLARSSS